MDDPILNINYPYDQDFSNVIVDKSTGEIYRACKFPSREEAEKLFPSKNNFVKGDDQ